MPQQAPPSSASTSSLVQMNALGLSVRSSLPLLGAGASVSVGSRVLDVVEVEPCEIEERAPATRATTVLERRYTDGSLGMRVSRHRRVGYRIDAPGHGTFLIEADGSRISCAQLVQPVWRWHRPLYAQALPLAATLQGLEPLHASGVLLAGKLYAFLAPSGTGKTSLAVHLAARGGVLAADDVVAVEYTAEQDRVVAYPGVPTANIAAEQLASLTPEQRRRLGEPIATNDKVQVALRSTPPGPSPLGALFLLERSEHIPRLSFERDLTADPRELLAATFMPHVSDAERLQVQLHLCAAVAAAIPVLYLRAPASVTGPELAAAVEQNIKKL